MLQYFVKVKQVSVVLSLIALTRQFRFFIYQHKSPKYYLQQINLDTDRRLFEINMSKELPSEFRVICLYSCKSDGSVTAIKLLYRNSLLGFWLSARHNRELIQI